MITDIQRFSLNDGPGIRTTVFFKGCPLHCAWCHNPESIHARRELMLYPEKCIGCGMCATVCPSGARAVRDGQLAYDPGKCQDCFACANVCFSGAIQLSGVDMSPEEIVEEVMKDFDYYRNSGGGVTLSGGEVLAQDQLAEKVLKLLKEKGVHTAIETSLFTHWETIAELLPLVDLVMADVKLFDSAAHKICTGVSNEPILENLQKLSETGVPMILRTPLIPGMTDSDENIASIAKFIASLKNVKYYELLNYNPLGESKYNALVRDYDLRGQKPLSNARVEALRKLAQAQGIDDVRVG